MNQFFAGVMSDYQDESTPPTHNPEVVMEEEYYQAASEEPVAVLSQAPLPNTISPLSKPRPVSPTPVQATSRQEFGHKVEPKAKTDDDFYTALRGVENSVKAGYDSDTGKWTSHESLEGGTDTLGYGHKLTPRESKGGYVMIGGEKVDTREGLNDAQVEQLFQQDVGLATRRLDKDIPDFSELPQKYKNILINISFNVGKVNDKKWPKLLNHMRAGNDEGVKEEMVTSYKDKDGNRNQLTERADAIAAATLA